MYPPRVFKAARVFGTLWIGSAPEPNCEELKNWDALVLSAWEHQPPPAGFCGLLVLSLDLDDSGPPPTDAEVRAAKKAAHQVSCWLRAEKRVLVTCRMGLNRSGLIVALALIEAYGLHPRFAIETVRRARGSEALNNPHFRKIIYEAPESRAACA